MRAYLKKLALSLLIAVLCTNCVLSAFAAEKTSEKEKQYLKEGIAASKDSFFRLYHTIWKAHGLDQKLADAINRGVDEKLGSLPWGTRGLHALFSSKVAEEAQIMVIELFTPHYEEFTKDLEGRFGEENNRNIALFYKNIAAEAIAENDNPAAKVFIREQTRAILKGNAEALQKQIVTSLIKKGRWAAAEGVASVGLALISTIAKDKLVTFFMTKLGLGTILTGVGGKIAEVAIPVAGQVLAVWEGFKSARAVLNAPEELKTKMLTGLSDAFMTQQPLGYWEVMGDEVRVMFEEAYTTFRLNRDEADEFANDPAVKALVEKHVQKRLSAEGEKIN